MKINPNFSSLRNKRPFFPIISILAVVLTLLILLGISTYRHLNRSQNQMEESLYRDGQIILKSLDTALRTGMMGMTGQSNNLQEIMNSVAALAEIHYIAMMNTQGVILAHTEERLVGTRFPDWKNVILTTEQGTPKNLFGKKGEFIVVRKMEPFSILGMGMGMHLMMRQPGSLMDQVLSGKVFAVVGLDTTAFEEARAGDLRHAVMMGLILLVLGTTGFYFIFLVQNHYLTQKALDSVTLYLNHVVDNMPDGLFSLDPQGQIVTLNNRAKEILHFEVERMAHTHLPKNLYPLISPILSSLKKKSPILEYEVEFPLPTGNSIPLSISAARIKSEAGEDQGTVIILRDLREIKELQEKIKRSERLASLGTLAAGMAHEIRNPLSSIKGFAQYFLKKNPPGSEEQKYSQVMIQEVERLNRVISNLLDFARPKIPQKVPVSINAVIDHCLELIQGEERSQGIVIKKEVEKKIPLIPLDKDQMTQVLLNLVLNALEALKEGGTIWIRSFLNQETDHLVIEVEDNGPGMNANELSRVFDPFYTTKKTGTGLGLATAYRIVENHGGNMTIKSEPGGGSLFRIELPMATENSNG